MAKVTELRDFGLERRLQKLIEEKRKFYDDRPLAAMAIKLRLMVQGEEVMTLADSGRPYAQIFYVEGHGYSVDIFLWAFRVDELRFSHPKEPKVKRLLSDSFLGKLDIPWAEIRKGSRNRAPMGVGDEFTFHAQVDISSPYWRSIEDKVLEDWEATKAASVTQ